MVDLLQGQLDQIASRRRWGIVRSSSVRRQDEPPSEPRSAAPLRVLLYAGAAALQCPGGGEVQLVKTAEYLRRRGVRAKLFNPWRDKLRDADCLHLFGTLPEHLPLVAAARLAGTPTVLSTIAWYDWRACWHLAASWSQGAWRVGRFLMRAALPCIPTWRCRLYREVNLLLPNSRAEAAQLRRLFRVPAAKICVVPNGVDSPKTTDRGAAIRDQNGDRRRISKTPRLLGSSTPRLLETTARRLSPSTPGLASERELFPAMLGVHDYVLCPGRIEPRKNQLTLLRALADLDRPVVFLGDPVPGCEAYTEACRRAAGKHVHFVPAVPHNSPLLASAYACAACVVLPGWFETPGLAALEAAAAEVPVVVTRVGAAREYFGTFVRYVDPRRPKEMGAAVRAALADGIRAGPQCQELSRRVRRHYTWNHVAEGCRRAYEKVVC